MCTTIDGLVVRYAKRDTPALMIDHLAIRKGAVGVDWVLQPAGPSGCFRGTGRTG